jgi:hypothetical protein
MAQSSAAITYGAVGNREDLMDLITNISPEETPMYTMFKKSKAKATTHEWLTDSLDSAAANAQIEAANFSFTTPGTRTRVSNYTQILTKTWEVSNTQDAVDKAGLDSEVSYQMTKAMKEWKRDAEYAIHNGTGNSGASGTAREMTGVRSFITTNVETGSGSGSEDLTETMYNDLLQTIHAVGGNPDAAFVNGWQKRKISGFTGGATKNVDASAKKLIANVDVYESDFGLQEIYLDRYATTSEVLALEKDKWAVAVLRPLKSVDVATVGDAVRGALVGEMTVEALNEAASGKITGLATS